MRWDTLLPVVCAHIYELLAVAIEAEIKIGWIGLNCGGSHQIKAEACQRGEKQTLLPAKCFDWYFHLNLRASCWLDTLLAWGVAVSMLYRWIPAGK